MLVATIMLIVGFGLLVQLAVQGYQRNINSIPMVLLKTLGGVGLTAYGIYIAHYLGREGLAALLGGLLVVVFLVVLDALSEK